MRSLKATLDDATLSLPDEHVTFLSEANGVAAYNGYVRLFGAGCRSCVDLRRWNEDETWKFAWEKDLGAFVCFGETGWGDQYAYKYEELASGLENVYVLDAFEMEPELISDSFHHFIETEFLRFAIEPYDEMIVAAFRRFGRLEWTDHVTYIPSLLLGGDECEDNIQRLNARASMIINGDLWSQITSAPGRNVKEVETFTDDRGRLRTRVIWL